MSLHLWASQPLLDGGLGRLRAGQGGLKPGHGFSAREGMEDSAGGLGGGSLGALGALGWRQAALELLPVPMRCPCPLQSRLLSCLSRPLGRTHGSSDYGWASGHLHEGLGEPSSFKEPVEKH